MIYPKRVAQLREAMAAAKLEAIYLESTHNRKYLTGFTGTAGFLVVTAEAIVLWTDFRYIHQAAKQAADVDVRQHGRKKLEEVGSWLRSQQVKTVGFEDHLVTVAEHSQLMQEMSDFEWNPAKQLVEKIRYCKDEQELVIIEQAAALADNCYKHILDWIRPGMTERAVSAEIEHFMRLGGADGTSFDTIVASGVRSALPHGVASNKVIAVDELITLDFGAYYEGYCSDLTRTFAIGQPPQKLHKVYEIVLEAQMTALAGIGPGMTGQEADAFAREVINKAGYGEQFGHGTGHGFGMEIHESPRLSPTGEQILEPGMTVTVEPGIYIEGLGGVRIEDDVVITETGLRVLTHADKNWVTIGQ